MPSAAGSRSSRRSHARTGRSSCIGVAVLSLGAADVLFSSADALPIAFVMIVASTWLGYRFSPAVGGVYTAIFATMAVLCTRDGQRAVRPDRGPHHAGDRRPGLRARDGRGRADPVAGHLRARCAARPRRGVGSQGHLSRGAARCRDERSITDGLIVVEASGQVMMRNPAAEAMMGPRRPAGRDAPDDYGIFQEDGASIAPGELPHSRALKGEAVPFEDLLRIDPDTGMQAILSVGAMPLHRTGGQRRAPRRRGHPRRHPGADPPARAAGLRGHGGPRPQGTADRGRQLGRDPRRPARRAGGRRQRAAVQPAAHRDRGHSDGVLDLRPARLLTGAERHPGPGLALRDRHGRGGRPRAARGGHG